jgi:hypothetical protein
LPCTVAPRAPAYSAPPEHHDAGALLARYDPIARSPSP